MQSSGESCKRRDGSDGSGGRNWKNCWGGTAGAYAANTCPIGKMSDPTGCLSCGLLKSKLAGKSARRLQSFAQVGYRYAFREKFELSETPGLCAALDQSEEIG